MKKYDFVREQIKQVKKEIKDREKWVKALMYEYTLERTSRYNQQKNIITQIEIGKTMVYHYKKVLEELETMLKDMIKIDGE